MLLPTWIDNIALRWHIIKRKLHLQTWLPSRFRERWWKWRGNYVRVGSWRGMLWNTVSRHGMAIEIINSQQSGLLTKGQMSQNPSFDGVEDLLVPLLTENLLAVGSSWGREKSLFSKDVVICRFPVLQWMAPHSSTYGWVALTRFNTLAKRN